MYHVTDNIFRITNGTTDLPSNSAFEFTDVGAITDPIIYIQ